MSGTDAFYEPLSVIDYDGRLNRTGDSQGHYTCDVKDVNSKSWFRTNDNCYPVQIKLSDVTKRGYVMLYRRI